MGFLRFMEQWKIFPKFSPDSGYAAVSSCGVLEGESILINKCAVYSAASAAARSASKAAVRISYSSTVRGSYITRVPLNLELPYRVRGLV